MCKTVVERLIDLCGDYSASRAMRYRLAELLTTKKNPTIVVPVCPDYGHADGRYNFRGLFGGVSLLTQKHIKFLDRVVEVLPQSQVIFLLADHEADDPELCRVVYKTREEFADLMIQSLIATRIEIRSRGWYANFMTASVPHLVSEEERWTKVLLKDEQLSRRIQSETFDRMEMYHRINRSFTLETMMERTAHTAAQYIAFGRFAAEARYLVCNHTTTNLSWYKQQTSVALLHNPIKVY